MLSNMARAASEGTEEVVDEEEVPPGAGAVC